MTEFRHADIVDLARRGHEHRSTPFRLASGELNRDYIDAKYPLSDGRALRAVGEYALRRVNEQGIAFTAVDGPTMGADALAHSMIMARVVV